MFALCELRFMQQLRTYLSANSETQKAFAKRVSVSPSHLSEIISGRKRPSLDIALAISRETGGEIPAEAWRSDPISGADECRSERVANSIMEPAEGCFFESAIRPENKNKTTSYKHVSQTPEGAA